MLPRLDPRSARRGRPARWHCRLRGLHCTGSPLTSKKLHRQPGVVAASSQEKPYPGRFRVGPVAQIGRKIDIVAQRSIASIQMRMNAARRAPKSRQDVRHIRGMSGAVAGAVSPRGRTAVTCRISSGRREAPLYGRPNSSSPPRRTNPPGRSCAERFPQCVAARSVSPSPRLRGEGWGEGLLPRVRACEGLLTRRAKTRRPLPASGERWSKRHRRASI